MQRKKLIMPAVFAVILLAIAVLVAFDHLGPSMSPVEEYDFTILQEGESTKAKSGESGFIDFSSINASAVIEHAVNEGNSIFIKSGNYVLNSDMILQNKRNARITSDGAKLKCQGYKIVIKGDNYTVSQNNVFSNLEILNGTMRIQNSFKTTISNCIFTNCTTAIEFVNTNTWSEGTKIDDSYFINSLVSIVFRSPSNSATGSYANTEINRCYFDLYRNNTVGIEVEKEAEFTDGLVENVRIWTGAFAENNQIGILVEGSMLQTLMQNVVFESFAEKPTNIYAMKVGENAEPPILGGGINFLGIWTARIHNPYGKWIFGLGGVFRREQVGIAIGLDSKYSEVQILHAYPLEITSFKARINVNGVFGSNETVTLRFRLELIDNAISTAVEKSFNQTATLWLDENDLFELAPSENMIWAILVDAKTDAKFTNVSLEIDVYGTTA